jgi:hypothetical protein
MEDEAVEVPEGFRTLQVVTDKETFRITIPAKWKVTFGAFSPGEGKGYGGDYRAALRLYEGRDSQRACFQNVTSFCDLSLPIQKLVVTESGSSTWEVSPDGLAESKQVKRSKKWEDA